MPSPRPSLTPSFKRASHEHKPVVTAAHDATEDERAHAALQRQPSNRSEAIQLAETLDRQLRGNENDFRATERHWRAAFTELVRQVYIHCAERGLLLDRVRQWYELELQRVGAFARHAEKKERKIRETMRGSDGISIAELDASDAVGLSSQRIELVHIMLKKCGGPKGFGRIIVEATRELDLRLRHELLHELLPQALPLPRHSTLTILSKAATAGTEEQGVMLRRLIEDVQPSHRVQMLCETLTISEGGLDAAESRVTDVLHNLIAKQGEMAGMEGAHRARRLMSKLAPAMPETSRGAAIGALIDCMPTGQKATALAEALEALTDGDAPEVIKEVCEHLTASHRRDILLPLMRDLSSEELTSILSAALARLKPEEFVASLGGRSANENLLAAMPLEMRKSLLQELPKALDGTQLAGILGPDLLQLWGIKLLAAAPESTQKGWLTQLLDQLKEKLTHSALSGLLVGVLSPEVFAYAYANVRAQPDPSILVLLNAY